MLQRSLSKGPAASRVDSHHAATTSMSGLRPWHPQRSCSGHQRRPGGVASGVACRAKNSGAARPTVPTAQDEEQEEYLEFQDPAVWDPEKGLLGYRVDRDFLDEMGSDRIDLEQTAYWFTPPPTGWFPEEKLKKAKEVEVTFPDPGPHTDYVEHRQPLAELSVGDEVEGVVTDVWLYHGAQVDFGGEFDGLIPISVDEWRDVADDFVPGISVKGRVQSIARPGLYRWPVQLALLDEPEATRQLAPLVTPPDQWQSPVDLGWAADQGWDMERICQETGRTYTDTQYYLERDHSEAAEELQHEYGWDEPDINGHELDAITRELDPYTQWRLEQQGAREINTQREQQQGPGGAPDRQW